jgi:hypothetical protein
VAGQPKRPHVEGEARHKQWAMRVKTVGNACTTAGIYGINVDGRALTYVRETGGDTCQILMYVRETGRWRYMRDQGYF